jgi:hypothetical protein
MEFIEQLVHAQAIEPNQECVVCYSKFMRLAYNEYKCFLEENTICDYYEMEENANELKELFDTLNLCYDVRFECLTCHNCVCRGCVPKMKGLLIPIRDSGARYEWPENIPGIMGKDGPITCPICKTKDYREYFTGNPRGKLPENILQNLKKKLN